MADQGLQMPFGLRWAIRYLTPRTAVAVRGEIPSPRPERFIRIQQTGGADTVVVMGTAQLLLEAWDTTALDAGDLALAVDALMGKAPGVVLDGIECRGLERLGLPYDSPDPESGHPRWRQNIALAFRKNVI